MIAAFLNGEIDVALDLVQADYERDQGRPTPPLGKAILEPAWLYEHFDMNQAGLGQGKGHPALKDPVVRKAIAQAIDKKAMWETVFPGAPYPDNNPCTNATPTNYWQLPERGLPAVRPRGGQHGARRGRLHQGADGIRVDRRANTPLVFEHCTSTAGFRQLGGDFIAKSLQDDRHQAQPQLRRLDRRSCSPTGRTSRPTRSATCRMATTTRRSSPTC